MGSNFQKINSDGICECIDLTKVFDIVPSFFETMDLNPMGKCLVYSRMINGKSEIGIQLCDGDANSRDNYIFWNCNALKSCNSEGVDEVSCNVHVQPITHIRVAIPACKLSPEQILAFREFFESTEQELLNNGLFDEAVSVRISLDYLALDDQQQDEEYQRKVRFGQRIRTIFKRRKK
jgi:hypothetical protein